MNELVKKGMRVMLSPAVTATSPTRKNVTKARKELCALLKPGPKKTADILDHFGYSQTNFVLTKCIGDRNGEYDNSCHQIALTELLNEDKVRWWYDNTLSVTYGLPKERRKNITGEKSPEYLAVTRFMDDLVSEAAKRLEDSEWRAPFGLVREIDAKKGRYRGSLSVSCDGVYIEVNEHDYVCGATIGDYQMRARWPCTSRAQNRLIKGIEKFFRSV